MINNYTKSKAKETKAKNLSEIENTDVLKLLSINSRLGKNKVFWSIKKFIFFFSCKLSISNYLDLKTRICLKNYELQSKKDSFQVAFYFGI